ncbi:uncharacterized protein HaLaN_05731, partial [Haematococcus lacustris]
MGSLDVVRGARWAQGLEDQLLGIVVAKERPDLEEEKNKLIITGAENKRKLKEIEDEILHVLSASKGNILEDEGAVNILQSSKLLSDEIGEKQMGAENKRKLKEIEDEILHVLSASKGNILEDEGAVNILQSSKLLSDEIGEKQMVSDETEAKIDVARAGYKPVAHHSSILYFAGAVNILQSSKLLSDEIGEKQMISDETEAKIDVARAGYKPVAHHSSILYFAVTDLASIDPMYQYSLRWFVDLFVRAIADSGQSDDLEVRLQLLNDHFTFFLYQNVCRSLFEKDKLLFAFLLASKLALDNRRMEPQELRFLLTGGVALGDLPNPNPDPDWISDKMWGEMCRLSDVAPDKGVWAGLAAHVAENPDDWKSLFDSPEPHRARMPHPWASKLDAFQRIVLLRTIRPDKLIPAVTMYVAECMGSRFVEPLPFAIEPSYNDSSATSPLIFVLSPGSDPMAALLKFADDKGIRVESVSLGQGQGPVAQRWISQGATEGFWV